MKNIHIFALDQITQNLQEWISSLTKLNSHMPLEPKTLFERLVVRIFTKRLLSESLKPNN
jgi:hypothetical protein